MIISRVLQNYFQNNMTTAKGTKNISNPDMTAEKKAGQKDPLEEYLEKWAQEKEIQQKALDEKLQGRK